MITYLAVKDGIETTIPDTQKDKYENLGFICSIYIPKIETQTTKKTKGEQ